MERTGSSFKPTLSDPLSSQSVRGRGNLPPVRRSSREKAGSSMQGDETLGTPRYVETLITVRFGDTDPYGVVYFASYFRYCHHGIEEFLRRVGLQPQEWFRNQEEGFGLPVAGASCDFLRPVWYGETLCLRTSIAEVKERALTFGFSFYRPGKTELLAQGRATIVAIDRGWKSRPLPERLMKALGPFLPSPEEPAPVG